MFCAVKLRVLLCVFVVLTACEGGCSRDPNLRKQKFFEQGNRSFEQGNYPEALIFYGRAIQIDPRFSAAHYRMARCYLNQGSWVPGYQEMQRTIDLQPENWPAQLDLGQLLFAANTAQEAKDRALLILHGNPQHADALMLLANSDAVLGNLKVAIEEANKATEMAPGRAAVIITLASIQMRAGALVDAEANLKRAQSADPASILPVVLLGAFYHPQSLWA